MKKLILSLFLTLILITNNKACADYSADKDYFNLFTQELIRKPEYYNFLLSYDNTYYYNEYDNKQQLFALDENTEVWQKYFNNTLTYEETDVLLKVIQKKHLDNLKKGILSHELFKKLGKDFYAKYKEGLDYLIEAKYLEPYMRFAEVQTYENENYDKLITFKSASTLNYLKNSIALISLYNASKNDIIKLRYAYQLVRFSHYSKEYQKAISYFKQYVEPLKKDTPIYWYALDQKAGALRGLGKFDEANWDFFQVFIHSRNKKESAYNSMFLAKDKNFQSLLNKSKTSEEKNFAYFLLAYNDFANPLPIMEKMFANNSNSDILKVLTARAINQMERNLLPVYATCNKDCNTKSRALIFHDFNQNKAPETISFTNNLQQFITKAKTKSTDEYWQLVDSYLKFIQGNFTASNSILNEIRTNDKDYLEQIQKMKILNEIVSQTKITPEFEELLMKKYSNFFTKKIEFVEYSWQKGNTTQDFIYDVLANRYFVQNDDAKAFLLNNSVSSLQHNPDFKITQTIEKFYKKPNKNAFENFLTNNIDVENPTDFFNVIYGDYAMRSADFNSAITYYSKAIKYKGIPRYEYEYGEKGNSSKKPFDFKDNYNGFKNISSLIFGHNVWESYESADNISMKAEDISLFPFIKEKMNKLELAKALLDLQKIGEGKDSKAVKANQLIGNLLYNTSNLGYYREIFVMDVNNANSPKFQFRNTEIPQFHYYYKGFGWNTYMEPCNFDLALNFYQKALQNCTNKEQKTRILFQMASAEQGKYYQYEYNNQPKISYDNENYSTKMDEFEKKMILEKNTKFRTYFAELKKNYATTQTYEYLQSSCLYFNYYTTKKK